MTTTDPIRSRGMRDLLPETMARVRRVERTFRDEMLAWGYEEIRTPTIEPLHLFTSAGTLAPGLLDRVYSFLDWDGWSGERVVLRPDATIPAARLFAERYQEAPAKLFYVQNIFRFAQDDAPREVWQCGAEVYGDTWPAGDIELIAAALRVLERLRLGPVTVRLSHTGLLHALLDRAGFSAGEIAERYDGILGGDLSVRREIEERLPNLAGSAHLLFDVVGTGAGYVENVRDAFAADVPAMATPLNDLAAVARALAAAGHAVEVSAALVRDFEYYTGPVFQFALADGSVAGGGGRYDDLVRRAGGAPVPACGFALSLDRLVALLPMPAVERMPVVLVEAAEESAAAMGLVLSVARELQDAGFRAELVGSRRAPDCRWRLLVNSGGGADRYHLRDLQNGAGMSGASMDAVIAALGRGRC